MKKLSTSKIKSQELRNLVNKLLIEVDEKDKRIAELEQEISLADEVIKNYEAVQND